MGSRDHRELVALRGSRKKTKDEASELVGRLDPADVLWVTGEEDAPGDIEVVGPRTVKRHLGESYEVVVIDFHDVFDADLLGQCHGFVWGGGALVLRLPSKGERPAGGRERLAAYPYGPEDVGFRFYERFERTLDDAQCAAPKPLPPANHEVQGTKEQSELAARLTALLRREEPTRSAVLADRGRGKSSAIGMALRSLREGDGREDVRIAVTAAYPQSAAEVFRFALGFDETPKEAPRKGPIRFVEPAELLRTDETFDVIVVDEAAQLSVALLRKLVERHSDTHLAFATTTHGYEGTGRGFEIRFLEWLHERAPRFERFGLEEPIRWAAGDPLEETVFDALLLDAEPADIDAEIDIDTLEHVRFDRDDLAGGERMLQEFFGLLVQAHYRTTPSDLHRMLDAPNLNLHALLHSGHVVAATWVAEEGALSPELCDDLYQGRRRILGHALPETFITHLGHRDAGELKMMRSVRIAVHPAVRRLGLGSRLVDSVHHHYEPDLFGTLFGATPGLLQFRRSVGYEVVRLGASRGRRAGEPSVAMIHPVSEPATELLEQTRREFARDLPVQLDLLEADADAVLDEKLRRSLGANLPAPPPMSPGRIDDIVIHYAFGPRTYASAAYAVERFVDRHADALNRLAPESRSLLDARVRQRRSWPRTMEAASLPSVPATMRALRRAVGDLLAACDDFDLQAE